MKAEQPSFPPNDLDLLEYKGIWVRDVTEDNSIRFCERIEAQFEENPYHPIIINISSYGGEVDALFTMLDAMDAIRSRAPEEFKFLTVATGKACSAGAVLLAYGDIRFATPQARLMLHQTISGTWGSQPATEIEFKENSLLNDRLLRVVKKCCNLKMSIKDLKAKLSHNLYLSPEEALEFGLIDVVGQPKVVEQRFYDIRVVNATRPKKKKVKANAPD